MPSLLLDLLSLYKFGEILNKQWLLFSRQNYVTTIDDCFSLWHAHTSISLMWDFNTSIPFFKMLLFRVLLIDFGHFSLV